MESSPLIKAHDFARAAAEATRSADSSIAISKHAQAAGEFSSAATNTSSVEALRTLQLLEQHHRKLSELLRFPHEPTSQQSAGGAEDESAAEDEKQNPSTDGPATPRGLTKGTPALVPTSVPPKPVPTLPHQPRYPTRELSSSIASNLASARGIKSKYRGQPLVPSISNEQAPGSLEVHPRADSPPKKRTSNQGQPPEQQPGKPSWVPPTPATPQRPKAAKTTSVQSTESPTPSQADEGFSRFYSTFGSIINRLSAPLAFAGLPLIAEEPATTTATAVSAPPSPTDDKTPQKKHRARTAPMAGTEPELSKIYSKAALRAMRGDAHGPNDSFYVVPTTGHTVSYANILTFDQKERRRMAANRDDATSFLGGDEDDDFVDAAESPPASPNAKRRTGPGRSERNLQNAVEELSLENKSLKEMLDKLSKRLHAFELNSQSSHLALAQSLRLQRPGSPMSSSVGGGGGKPPENPNGEDGLKKKNQELEEQLAGTMKQMDMLQREYSKVQQTLEKYRDRWEKLKAGAKARREAQGPIENGDSSRSAR